MLSWSHFSLPNCNYFSGFQASGSLVKYIFGIAGGRVYVQILKVSNLKLKLNIKQKNILQLRIMI